MTSHSTGIKYTLILKILFLRERFTCQIDEPQTAAPAGSGSPKLIKGVGEKPVGCNIREYWFGDDGIRIYDLTNTGLREFVTADLSYSSEGIMIAPPVPGGLALFYEVFGHKFDPTDVERVLKDDEVIWVPREMREINSKKYQHVLEQGIITLELLVYPELVKFIKENREAFARLGLHFDK